MTAQSKQTSRGAHAWFQKITWKEAEKIAGSRLDRRCQYYKHSEEGLAVKNPFAFNGSDTTPKAKILTYSEWTESCSGCSEYSDGHVIYEEAGCSECGHTGKRINGMHTPVNAEDFSNG